MAVVDDGEFPDLDNLINAADNRSGTGESSGDDKGAFDPDEYAGVVQRYNEQSRNLQQHYDTHMEQQKQKLAEENEAGFLEALQQSLQNFESDHMTDFASLSTSLDNMLDTSEKPSLLKELLLSPFSNNYTREVDSTESQPQGVKSHENLSVHEQKKCSKVATPKSCPNKRLKLFTELLKHMEAAEDKIKKKKFEVKPSGTRLVSTKRYLNKYGSASNGALPKLISASEKPNIKPASKRVVLHPVAVSGKSIPGGRKTLTLALKSSTAAKFLDSNSKPLIRTSGTMTVGNSATNVVSIGSRSMREVSETEKRPNGDTDGQPLAKKTCVTLQSVDHDYCTGQLNHASSIDSGQGKPSSQKILKWQDYLQQVREGVRSAPNSPASSPRVVKGSARQSNNFMVVSLQGNQIPSKVLSTASGKAKSETGIPIPQALKKTTVKTSFELQEFGKYISKIQNTMNSPKTTGSIANNVTVIESAPQRNSIPPKNVSASYSLAAMVQRHQQTSLSNEKPYPIPSSQYGTTLVSNGKELPAKSVALSDSSGQLKIQLPTSSRSLTQERENQRSAAHSSVGSTKSVCDAECSSATKKQLEEMDRPSCSSAVSSTASDVTDRVTEASTKTRDDNCTPTFKLMACNKDGAEGKSLILSGVSGKLKDILTLLAEQQAKCKAENKNADIDEDQQQLQILQRLISCMNSNTDAKVSAESEINSKTRPNTKGVTKDPEKTSKPCPDVVEKASEKSIPKSHNGIVGELNADKASINCHMNLEQTIEVQNVSVKCETDAAPSCQNFTAVNCQPLAKGLLSSHGMLISSSFSSTDSKCSSTGSETNCDSTLSHEINSTPRQMNEPVKILTDNDPGVAFTEHDAAATNQVLEQMVQGNESVIAMEPTEAVATSDSQENKDVKNESCAGVSVHDDDPAVITLEEALMELVGGDDENDGGEVVTSESQSMQSSFNYEDNLFCKLPSYFLTGKMMNEEKHEEDAEGFKKRGMKDVLCDPVIGVKNEDKNELEFNKLPHYFSSGKPRLNSSESRDQTSTKRKNGNECAIKLSPVGEGHHLTPQGTPVDTSQTYYSRLPSYYSYGRPHPPVKTFNDDAADAKDDTVTPETLERERDNSKHRKRSKKKEKKRKHKKHKRGQDEISQNEASEKILYSKLPSYYMCSRVLRSRERDNQRVSPLSSSVPRQPSISRSPSPRSLSYSSRSSRSRSRSHDRSQSRNRKRRRSRSYSNSPSYSSYDSDGGSQRSWRNERRCTRNRREKSYDRRGYGSSDDDQGEYKRRREREVRRAKKQHRDWQEKENQIAMEERRVVYVGGIEDKMTKQELRRKFLKFGNIETVSLFFRDDGDNYGFLTFQYTCDAFRAIEEGAKVGSGETCYDLCFGGRRQFCRTRYEDLDSKVAAPDAKDDLDDFDALLQRAQRGLRH